MKEQEKFGLFLMLEIIENICILIGMIQYREEMNVLEGRNGNCKRKYLNLVIWGGIPIYREKGLHCIKRDIISS